MASPAAPPRQPPLPLSPVPWPMILLAIPSILIGLVGIFLSLQNLSDALHDRQTTIVRQQESTLALYDAVRAQKGPDPGRALGPLFTLPRPDVERLAGLLADERYEHRGVTVPLSLLNLLVSWLLCTGAMGTLRRSTVAISVWSWAAVVNLPFAVLSVIVLLVRSREIMDTLGGPTAQALAAISKRPVQAELDELWTLCRTLRAVFNLWSALWALYLCATVLYLRRYLPRDADERVSQ